MTQVFLKLNLLTSHRCVDIPIDIPFDDKVGSVSTCRERQWHARPPKVEIPFKFSVTFIASSFAKVLELAKLFNSVLKVICNQNDQNWNSMPNKQGSVGFTST